MQYKVLVTDLDGTLLDGARPLAGEVAAALEKLQEKGVLLVVATGRAPSACTPAILQGLVPDYYVCVNGACIQGAGQELIRDDRMTPADIDALVRFAEAGGHPLCFPFDDGYYAYTQYETYARRYRDSWGDPRHMRDGTSHTRHKESLPLGAYILMPAEAAEDFEKECPGLRPIPVGPSAFDVCKNGNNKAVGVGHLLETLGLGWQDVVAVGDGDNDVEMLQKAGVSVAVGNASPAALDAAQYVAPPVSQNGILWVLDRFFS